MAQPTTNGGSSKIPTSRTIKVVKYTMNRKRPILSLDVYIEGCKYEKAMFAEMFALSYCSLVDDPLEADLVVFTGGEDVSPSLYGENPHPTTFCNPARDQQEIDLFNLCIDNRIPMLGICRGAQLLHVLHGGKLYQDIDNHNGDHSIWDTTYNCLVGPVSSVHHQAVRRNMAIGMKVLAEVAKSQNRWYNDKDHFSGVNQDIEAFVFPDTCAIGIQGHPEYPGYPAFTEWVLKIIEDWVILNTDVNYEASGHRRIDPSTVEYRKEHWKDKGFKVPSLVV